MHKGRILTSLLIYITPFFGFFFLIPTWSVIHFYFLPTAANILLKNSYRISQVHKFLQVFCFFVFFLHTLHKRVMDKVAVF